MLPSVIQQLIVSYIKPDDRQHRLHRQTLSELNTVKCYIYNANERGFVKCGHCGEVCCFITPCIFHEIKRVARTEYICYGADFLQSTRKLFYFVCRPCHMQIRQQENMYVQMVKQTKSSLSLMNAHTSILPSVLQQLIISYIKPTDTEHYWHRQMLSELMITKDRVNKDDGHCFIVCFKCGDVCLFTKTKWKLVKIKQALFSAYGAVACLPCFTELVRLRSKCSRKTWWA